MKTNNSNRRSRGRGGQRRSSHSGGSNQQQKNKPNIGNVKQQLERYKSLAREAVQADDRVQAEAYYQHAEHFQRVLNEFEDRSGRHSDSKNDASQSDARSEKSDGPSDGEQLGNNQQQKTGEVRKVEVASDDAIGNVAPDAEKAPETIEANSSSETAGADQAQDQIVTVSAEEKPAKKPRARSKKVAAE